MKFAAPAPAHCLAGAQLAAVHPAALSYSIRRRGSAPVCPGFPRGRGGDGRTQQTSSQMVRPFLISVAA